MGKLDSKCKVSLRLVDRTFTRSVFSLFPSLLFAASTTPEIEARFFLQLRSPSARRELWSTTNPFFFCVSICLFAHDEGQGLARNAALCGEHLPLLVPWVL
eukprot:Amastigsp_a676223_6107.p3 type:complete len:101 gc:universal Amastigsp_a676223_6107:1-303(+)